MAFGILASILGGGIAEPIKAIGAIVDNVFTSDDERLTHKEILARITMEPAKMQVELNKIEAQHRSKFVAGWRPFIGWVCGVALAWNYIAHPLAIWLLLAFSDGSIPAPPQLSLGELMPVIFSLLGLGTLRTGEKLAGRAK